MNFKKIDGTDIHFFQEIVGDKGVLTSSEVLATYSHDETEDLRYFPEVVLKPSTTEQVSSILSYCNERQISVTACGARTGLSGDHFLYVEA